MENQPQESNNQPTLDLKIVGFSQKILHIQEAGKYELALNNDTTLQELLLILSGLSRIKSNQNQDILLNGISINEDKIVAKFIQKNAVFLAKNTFYSKNTTLQNNIKLISLMYKGYNLSPAVIHSFMFNDIEKTNINTLSQTQLDLMILSYVVACPALIWFIDKELIANLTNEQKLIFENAVKIRIKQGGVCVFCN